MASPEALKLLRDLQLSDQNMVRVRARGPHSSGRAAPTPETDCGPSAKQNTHRWGDSGGDGADAGGTQRHRTAARDWFWIAQAGRRCGDTPTYTGSAYGRRTSPLVPARQRNRPCFEHPRSRRPRLCRCWDECLGTRDPNKHRVFRVGQHGCPASEVRGQDPPREGPPHPRGCNVRDAQEVCMQHTHARPRWSPARGSNLVSYATARIARRVQIPSMRLGCNLRSLQRYQQRCELT
jgi:hypothetical protein